MLIYNHLLPKTQIVDRDNWILQLCKDKKILHLGCVDKGLVQHRINTKSFFHSRLIDVGQEVWGIDIDKDGLSLLRKMGFKNLLYGNVENLDKIRQLKRQKFDIILAGEIIEHLQNPGQFLSSCKHLMENNSIIIISTPNAFKLQNFILILFHRELVHPDHVCWYSPTTLQKIILKSGYRIRDFYITRNQTSKVNYSIKSRTSKLGRFLFFLMEIIIRNLLIRIWPFFGDGLLIIINR